MQQGVLTLAPRRPTLVPYRARHVSFEHAMSIRNILVPLSDPSLDTYAMEAAVNVAVRLGAHIEVMFIRDTNAGGFGFISSRLGTGLYQEVLEKLQVEIEEQDQHAQRNFREFIAGKEIPISREPSSEPVATASWHSHSGVPADVVTRLGGTFDLIVMSHPRLGSEGASRQLLEAAIFGSARPVLLASESARSPIGKSVLLAWNRGIQSNRALVSSMPFLAQADKVAILTVTTGAKHGPEPEDIAANLAWHGVSAEVRRIRPNSRPVDEIILDDARNMGADLLVMGAYSQSRMRERVLGGVTKAILSGADLPVLMVR